MGIKVRTDLPKSDIWSAERNAKQVIRDRIVTPFARRFNSEQIDVLNHYRAMYSKDTSTGELFKRLFDSVVKENIVASKPEKWKTDAWNELSDISQGIFRMEHSVTLHNN